VKQEKTKRATLLEKLLNFAADIRGLRGQDLMSSNRNDPQTARLVSTCLFAGASREKLLENSRLQTGPSDRLVGDGFSHQSLGPVALNGAANLPAGNHRPGIVLGR